MLTHMSSTEQGTRSVEKHHQGAGIDALIARPKNKANVSVSATTISERCAVLNQKNSTTYQACSHGWGGAMTRTKKQYFYAQRFGRGTKAFVREFMP